MMSHGFFEEPWLFYAQGRNVLQHGEICCVAACAPARRAGKKESFLLDSCMHGGQIIWETVIRMKGRVKWIYQIALSMPPVNMGLS